MFSLSGVVLDSKERTPLAGLQVALSEAQNPSVTMGDDGHEPRQLTVVTTDDRGAWTFDVAPGHDYVVRMPSHLSALAAPGEAEGVWIFGGFLARNVSESVENITLEAEYFPAVERTAENDAAYVAGVMRAALLKFEDETKNPQSFDEVTKALKEARTTLNNLLSAFEGQQLNVPCSSCQRRCYGSTDPQCVYKCIYLPQHCYY